MEKAQHHIMVVSAHCGDGEIMAGGIIAKYTKHGHKASIVHLTPGEKGHKTLPPDVYAAQKVEEATAAGKVLGADVYCLPYRDAELPNSDDVKYELADIIRQAKPTVILTHWKESMHKDHTNTSLIAEDARFYAALPAIERSRPAHGAWGFYYCENWEDPYNYEPSIYVDITDVFDTYIEGLKQYELFRGGISSFRYMDYYRALAVTRGCLSNCEYAQTLMLPKGSGVRKGPFIPGYEL